MAAPEIGVLLPLRLETRFNRSGRPPRWSHPCARRARRDVDREPRRRSQPRSSSTRSRRCGEPPAAPTSSRRKDNARGGRSPPRSGPSAARGSPARSRRSSAPTARSRSPGLQQTRTDMRAPRVLGLPPTLEIWIARGGAAPAQAARLTVRATDVDLDLDNPNSTKQPWWTSFKEAERVGLAAEIDLGTATPTDIDAIYVVGIGGGDPGPLLASQADSGRLGIVSPGSATSTVDGKEAISLGDVDAWRRLVPVGTNAQAGTVAVSKALAGVPRLRGVIGGADDHRPLNRAVMGVLWPAMWGHSLANVWGFSTQADELGLWAAANLVPEGPLPSLRIEEQPYGLLPATSLARWKATDGDPAIEARLVPLVRSLVAIWAAAAERQAGEQQGDVLRGLVRNPTAARYAWQWMVPTTLAHALAFRFNQSVPAADLNAWWTRQAERTPRLDPAAPPARKLVAVGWRHEIDVDLVEPANPPDQTDPPRRGNRRPAARRRCGGGALADAAPVGHEPSHRARTTLAARKLGRGRTPDGGRGASGR